MAIAETTLAGAKALNDTFLSITTTTGIVRGKLIRVDDEYFKVSADASGTNVPVICGQEGRAQAAHSSGTQVFWGDPSDFPSAPAGTAIVTPVQPTVLHTTYTPVTSGTVPIPVSQQGVHIELLGTVTTAQIVVDPTYAQEGQVVTIQAGAATAFLLNAKDAAGAVSEVSWSGDQDIATFGGAIGDGFSFKANNLAWLVLYKTNVTLTDS